jgi:thymidylate synthase
MSEQKAVFQDIYQRLKAQGKFVSPRGLKVLEVENFSYELPPYARFANFEPRNLSLSYIKKEFLWYLRGDLYDTTICEHARIWKPLVVKGKLNSNYGHYAFVRGAFDWCSSELVHDKDSRRASIPILAIEHLRMETKDMPCTAYLNFRIRENRLNMSVRMRSQDLVFGLGNDAPAFSFIHEMLFVELLPWYPELELGSYHHVADSAHIYERHFELLERLVDPSVQFDEIEVPQMAVGEPDTLVEGKFQPELYPFTAWLIAEQ